MREVDPNTTPRAQAFALWGNAPMPMVTLTKTLDVTPLVRASRRRGWKFNMLLCWCIGSAAAETPDFYLLPVGQRLMEFDTLAVNVVVAAQNGAICTCDIPISPDLDRFNRDYLSLTGEARRSGRDYNLPGDPMVIGTSALAHHRIDSAVNLYAGCYNNPFLIWGQYRRGLFRTTLPVSFQFHHAQMDGIPAAAFLDRLQRVIRQVDARRAP